MFQLSTCSFFRGGCLFIRAFTVFLPVGIDTDTKTCGEDVGSTPAVVTYSKALAAPWRCGFFTVKTVAKVGRNPTRKTGFEKLVMLTFKTKGYGYAFGNLPEMGCFSSLEKVEQSIYYISTCFAGLVSCQFFLGVCLCALLGCPVGILRIKGDVRISGL